jgi:enoyl-CoA hydratase/carnithine racemase
MGAFLLLSTDLRIGADSGARIQINEVKIGLVLPRFAIEVCRQRLAPAHFSRAALTAEPYSGQQAVAAGFLDEVCPAESLAATALERAKGASRRCTSSRSARPSCACAKRRSTPSVSRSNTMLRTGARGSCGKAERLQRLGLGTHGPLRSRVGAGRPAQRNASTCVAQRTAEASPSSAEKNRSSSGACEGTEDLLERPHLVNTSLLRACAPAALLTGTPTPVFAGVGRDAFTE